MFLKHLLGSCAENRLKTCRGVLRGSNYESTTIIPLCHGGSLLCEDVQNGSKRSIIETRVGRLLMGFAHWLGTRGCREKMSKKIRSSLGAEQEGKR